MDNELGLYLRKLRKEHKMTQEQVASKLHLIRQSYSHYETGRTRPTLDALYRLAKLYEVPFQTLIAFELPRDKAAELASDLVSGIVAENIYTLDQVIELLPSKEKELVTSFHQLSSDDQQDLLAFIRIKLNRE